MAGQLEDVLRAKFARLAENRAIESALNALQLYACTQLLPELALFWLFSLITQIANDILRILQSIFRCNSELHNALWRTESLDEMEM